MGRWQLLGRGCGCGTLAVRIQSSGTRRGATLPAPGLGQHLIPSTGLVAGNFFMETQVLTITPAMAESFLAHNTRNRPVSATHLAMFEAMLQRGELQLTHQGVAISDSGVLLDGQHRLLAILNTGIPATMMVTTGLPDAVFAVLDTGSKRTASDILSIDGAKNATSIASAIRLYILYTQAPHIVWTGKVPARHATTTLIDKEFNLDKETWELVGSIVSNQTLLNVSLPGPMACLVYLAFRHCHYSVPFLEGFVSQLKMGDNLSIGSPLLAYRNKMIGQARPTAQARLADYIKLFNAYVTGQQLKIFKSQPFPPMPTLVDAHESIHDGAAL